MRIVSQRSREIIMRLVFLLFLGALAFADRNPDEEPIRERRRIQKEAEIVNGVRKTEDYLLPTAIYPLSYDVSIIPQLETNPFRRFQFDGIVVTRLFVENATSSVVMHAWDLTIFSIDLHKVSDNSMVGIQNWDILLDDRQFFTINLQSSLEAGTEYSLRISYTGIIHQNDYYGLYTYSYIEGNETRHMAVTDLESTGARRVVPWFDQPTYKANITLHVAKEPGRIITANMPVEPGYENWVWVNFAESPPISTYIFCFSVHQYASVQSSVDQRITNFVRPDVVIDTDYVLSITPTILNYFENYTSIPFSLPKMDQMGLLQFNWGGMENWGLITYRERYLLFNESVHTTFDKQRRVVLVAHEVAHQWFGDLVSPFWWSSTWLNEGFATYFETQSSIEVGPDWQLDEQFIVDTMQYALRVDASPNTHPMYSNVDTPSSIDRAFDGIAYEKSGCVVKFMVNFFGQDQFQAAITDYLNTMAYKSADQSDLFRIITPYAPPLPNGLTFTQMMETWTLQAGFPLITVTRDYNTRTATITQERFGSSSTEKWIIPIMMTTSEMPDFNDMSPKAWLLADGNPVSISAPLVPSNLQWIILNNKEMGFYRVNYDETNWALIAAYLGTPGGVNAIVPENRAQMMNDAMALALVGRLSYTTALRTTAYLNLETRVTPWRSATSTYVLGYIRDRMYQTEEGVQLFQNYMRQKLATVYADVNGFQFNALDSHATLLSRYTATRWYCDMDSSTCNADGSALFRQWQLEVDPEFTNPIVVDLRSPAYCAGQREGGLTDYDFLLARYQNAPVYSDESIRLINAMGCASDISILQKLLNASMNPLDVAPGDSLNALRAVSYNPIGVNLALDFVIANWIVLDPLYGNIGNGFNALSSKLNTQEHYDKILNFRKDNMAQLSTAAVATIQTTLNLLQETLNWNFANLNTVMDYFRQSS
ncbi:hypothetical protein B566_EDAN004108 [Ephemera danica]|nr:hypothetical protein B566_EDAN004108 [Ephemera danica]